MTILSTGVLPLLQTARKDSILPLNNWMSANPISNYYFTRAGQQLLCLSVQNLPYMQNAIFHISSKAEKYIFKMKIFQTLANTR